jgi:nucleotide-binding universal stress UspA family protein
MLRVARMNRRRAQRDRVDLPSTQHRIGRCEPCLVLGMYPFRRILVAIDFGESSARAIELATGLACEYGADLTVAHTVELLIPPYPVASMADPRLIEAAAQQELDSVVARIRQVLPLTRGVLLRGTPADKIVEYAEREDTDLLVIGTHGRKGPSRWLMGSVAEKILRSSHIPVLTAHEEDKRRHISKQMNAAV